MNKLYFYHDKCSFNLNLLTQIVMLIESFKVEKLRSFNLLEIEIQESFKAASCTSVAQKKKISFIILKDLPRHKHKSKGEALGKKRFTKLGLHTTTTHPPTQTFRTLLRHLGG